MFYFAKIAKDGRGYSVVFPDCPGCQTCGDDREDAARMAADALEGWLAATLLAGEVPPRPARVKGTPIGVSPRLASALQIRWVRADLGLTQRQLAERVGVSQQQIAKLENPDANPTLGTLAKVAEALGLRVDVTISAA